MAFGTGEHATTATCRRLLADIAAELPAGFTALDLGTGAGILAIAAKALGASRVEAVDYDPVAVRIAQQNASTNGFRTIKVSRGDVLKLAIRRPFDVVLANLFSDVLIAAAPRIAHATARWLADFFRRSAKPGAGSCLSFTSRRLLKPPSHRARQMVRGNLPEGAKRSRGSRLGIDMTKLADFVAT